MGEYETVIGLEVHVELATKSKIFCGCSTAFGGEPNTHVCPVCLGMPGALPVLNQKAVEYAVAVGLSAHCEITRVSYFDRKNYFYPDNPQNYQISQLYYPICRNGYLEIEGEDGTKKIGIHEIHLEEDAGKLIHEENGGGSRIDYNRSGVPLIEIVSEPDLASAGEVIAYLEQLRVTIQYLGASDCKLQEGSMRADVNLSLRKAGEAGLGVRTEMKNLSSFRAIAQAIAHEAKRQEEILSGGGRVVQETRRWDENEGCSYSMRSKEDAKDYRYFPEPDLPPLVVSDEWMEEIRGRIPELREEKKARYRIEYGLSEYDIGILTESRQMAEFFEDTVSLCRRPKETANWLIGEAMRLRKESGGGNGYFSFSPKHLAGLIRMVEAGEVNRTTAKVVFEQIFRQDVDPEVYVKEHGLGMTGDAEELREAVRQVLEQNPQPVADYKGGKEKAFGFLVGQSMKATKGKADPGKIRELLKDLLS
ncbi:Asp-tRNA(Asn)/Glu-tRNA(Gln) amidotransferase subunit GatB [Cuneatibacter sp. NSJ-177]|uniref:Asp-tRNA(Asn)/Glu-tRNA(Gln) amidotransferase subunit GatB n=1 Tax=Cuneatibacter sp. NSJ-177 TaxID=2931401 RepID=UPI001FD5520A|nr:Asp-tRNA(Asn)/Glu-tRNA(Gln) amidotransferase subunit GatB [Cuneatibacter sp. NSJ-177]MCJ7837264.1 Asp-tRNA(Asn)/Glu-tRNA(Gln) amidotransferase subunit GatB [Cuneatibacter sp. NSJ-177]